MIRRLRRRFIRITMISVALVMLLLTAIVNGASFLSTNAEVCQTLTILSENQGSFPAPLPGGGGGQPGVPPENASGSQAPALPSDSGAVEPPDAPGKKDPMSRFGPEAPYSTRYFVLWYDDAGILLRSDLGHIAAVTEDEVGPYLNAAVRHGEGFGSYGGYRFLVSAGEDGEVMAIFLDCYQARRTARALAGWSLAADGVCLVLVYLLVSLFSRRAIDPVVRSAQQQKQFITDASHELKTPLTVITTCLKVLEMEVGQQRWIDKAQAQADKMSKLVGNLVSLSRLDEEEPPITLTDFDISAAVEDAAESFRDSAQAAGHPLELTVPPGITYHGDEAAIRQLVSILLDNAIKYALPGGAITLKLSRAHRGVVLQSANPCQTLDKEQLGRLFDRFYRPDDSRTGSTGGFGIGLSLARSIAEAHKGAITAAMPAPGMIEFTAVLR